MGNEQVLLAETHDPLETLARLHEQNVREIHANARYSQIRLLITFVITLIIAGIFYMFTLQVGAPPVTIENLRAVSSAEICPGERITYSYELVGDEAIVINVIKTIWRVTPPQTVVYSGSQLDILIPPISYIGGENFVMPEAIFDPFAPELVPTLPGVYERRIAVTAVGRDTKAEVAGLPFTVKECP